MQKPRLCGGSLVKCTPSTVTPLRSALRNTATMLSKVDLPDPLAPSRVRNSPALISRLTSVNTVVLPKDFRTPSIRTGAPDPSMCCVVISVSCMYRTCFLTRHHALNQPAQSVQRECQENHDNHKAGNRRDRGIDLYPDTRPHTYRQSGEFRSR